MDEYLRQLLADAHDEHNIVRSDSDSANTTGKNNAAGGNAQQANGDMDDFTEFANMFPLDEMELRFDAPASNISTNTADMVQNYPPEAVQYTHPAFFVPTIDLDVFSDLAMLHSMFPTFDASLLPNIDLILSNPSAFLPPLIMSDDGAGRKHAAQDAAEAPSKKKVKKEKSAPSSTTASTTSSIKRVATNDKTPQDIVDEAVAFAKQFSISLAAKKYAKSKATIHRWVHCDGNVQERGRPRLLTAEDEEELLGKISGLVECGLHVNRKIIEDMARELYVRRNGEEGASSVLSHHWFRSFRSRHAARLVSHKSQLSNAV